MNLIGRLSHFLTQCKEHTSNTKTPPVETLNKLNKEATPYLTGCHAHQIGVVQFQGNGGVIMPCHADYSDKLLSSLCAQQTSACQAIGWYVWCCLSTSNELLLRSSSKSMFRGGGTLRHTHTLHTQCCHDPSVLDLGHALSS